jgi:hypothetical protein
MNYNLVSQSFKLNTIIFKLYESNSRLSLETEQKTTYQTTPLKMKYNLVCQFFKQNTIIFKLTLLVSNDPDAQ